MLFREFKLFQVDNYVSYKIQMEVRKFPIQIVHSHHIFQNQVDLAWIYPQKIWIKYCFRTGKESDGNIIV